MVYLTIIPRARVGYEMIDTRRVGYNHLISNSSVRVKGGKSLRNGMWNGVRNGIIMQNTIYAGNKLTEERILFSRQLYKSSSFFDVADY